MIPFQFRFIFKTKYFINFQAFGVFLTKESTSCPYFSSNQKKRVNERWNEENVIHMHVIGSGLIGAPIQKQNQFQFDDEPIEVQIWNTFKMLMMKIHREPKEKK